MRTFVVVATPESNVAQPDVSKSIKCSVKPFAQVLAKRGVSPIHDRALIKAAGRELAEACNMTPAEMDQAAHHLIKSGCHNTQLPYFDHLSGYELKDYTQRSLRGDRTNRVLQMEPVITGGSSSEGDENEQEMVYVTTL